MIRPLRVGSIAALLIFGINAGVIVLISGPAGLSGQLRQNGVSIALLAILFGVQVGLFTELRQRVRRASGKSAVVASGASGSAAMLACCSHYLTSIVPLVAFGGVAAAIGRAQPALYQIALLINLAGVIIISRRVRALARHEL
jgi:Cu+-exporting ATPase